MTSNTKMCSICEEEKDLSNFYSQKTKRKDGSVRITYQPYCKECISKRYQENKDEIYRKKKAQRQKNPQSSRDVARRYRKNHLEKVNANQKKWRQENPDKVKEYNDKYKEKQFKIPNEQWEACKEYFNNCCAYCGVSEQQLKDNNLKALNKEHAINMGSNDVSNCIPSCTSCNSLKNKNDYVDWYTPDNPIFNEDRLVLIHKWLEEDHKLHNIN
jgi:hypothetical protein